MIAIEAVGVGHAYGKHWALDDLDVRVPAGQACGLLGPNGAGKTTLMGILSTRLVPTKGESRILGLDTVREAPAIRRRIGLVHGENLRAEPDWSCVRYLRHVGRCYGLSRAEAQARALECLRTVGYDDDPSRQVGKLSGGNARKVEIARALLHEPAVLLLDEPTRELDLRARQSVWAHLKDLARAGTAVLLASHDPLEIARVCDRVVILQEGRVGWQGRVEAFSPDPPKALAEALEGRYPPRTATELHQA